MLQKSKPQAVSAAKHRFAIVASQYNDQYVDSMLRAAKAVLKASKASHIEVIRVPGAYEIPLVAAELAKTKSGGRRYSAIVCLGVILRGETTHAAHIGEAVSAALMQIQIEHSIPIIHEVLLLENHDQARDRCLDPDHNRGTEAAETAISMALAMSELRSPRRYGTRRQKRGMP
jgi:6,7-dimethyl-8-ribityllumazine synthase